MPTWRVTELDAPRRFVWEAQSPGLRMIAEHSVSQQAANSSTVVLRFSFGGLLGGLFGRLFRSITKRYLTLEAAALRRTVEASPNNVR